MNIIRPDTLRGQTILVVGVCLLAFHIASLILYIIFSASTVTVEREEQIADRIVTITRLIEHARLADWSYLAGELSGPKFQISIDKQPLADVPDENAAEVINLITRTLGPMKHAVAADYRDYSSESVEKQREVAIQRLTGLFRIHETLLVSVDLPDGSWLNFRVSGSAWDHIFSLSAIPSLALMALGAIFFTAWAVNKPLKSLSHFAKASEDMGINIHAALPVSEAGPREIREAARAFNHMQTRVQRLLEARNHMLGAISHDFRTPLTRLRLRVESITSDEQRNKAISDLDEMEAMIKLTLKFARDEAAEESRTSLDLATLIREIVAGLDTAGNRISVQTSENIHAVCQPVGIRRALTNIIENGIFYGEQIFVEMHQADDNVIINVDDDGPGIELQHREQVFTPFYRLESSRNRETGGAGLGLSIAQTIVHAHGGMIKLLDSPMGGLRVRIVLPNI
jgi:signal transduction histidine kinase